MVNKDDMTDPIAVPHTNTPSTLAATTPSSLASSGVVDYLAEDSEARSRRKSRERMRRWRNANPEKKRELSKRWYAANREKTREASRRWYRANTKKRQETKKRWYRANPEKQREMGLKKLTLTIQQYDTLLAAQNGVCAICKQPNSNEKRLSVDHDHRCCPGKRSCGRCVRGLLCTNCNHALGKFRDLPAVLFAAFAYILKHAEKETQTTWQQPRLEHQQEHPL
jgi:hypothetical protein